MATLTNFTASLTSLENATTPAYYATEYRIVAVIMISTIFVVGIVGNTLVIVVVVKTRSMHTPTNCYLLSLAIADCLVLLSATLPAIPENFFRLDEWRYGEVLCHLMVFVQYMGCASSALFITAFTVERYIAVCHPIKAHTMCTVQRAKRIIVVLWIFTISYSSPWIVLTKITKRQYIDGSADYRCVFKYKRNNYLAYYMLDIIVFYFIPILITVILYARIGRVLMTSGSMSESSNKTQSYSVSQGASSRNQVIRMLCVVVILFAILLMPYRVLVVYNSFANVDFMDLWFLLFCRTLVYVNSAINPILYNAMSGKFRRAFRKLLCCHTGGGGRLRIMNTENSDVGKWYHMGKRMAYSTRIRNGTATEQMSMV